MHVKPQLASPMCSTPCGSLSRSLVCVCVCMCLCLCLCDLSLCLCPSFIYTHTLFLSLFTLHWLLGKILPNPVQSPRHFQSWLHEQRSFHLSICDSPARFSPHTIHTHISRQIVAHAHTHTHTFTSHSFPRLQSQRLTPAQENQNHHALTLESPTGRIRMDPMSCQKKKEPRVIQ
jgi:hypothetical protein